ncbi:MAG: hypothetical protein ACOC44_01050 [Promethearchaeia archaeon]
MPQPKKDKKNSKLQVKLVTCQRCGNAFMKEKDSDPNDLICDNCKELAKRKKELQIEVMDNVIDVENKMEDSIREMKDQLKLTKGKFNKQFFMDKIKSRAASLSKSIELLEKIEETNDEKYFEEYRNLFSKIKKDNI